jgi:hypothetical protein
LKQKNLKKKRKKKKKKSILGKKKKTCKKKKKPAATVNIPRVLEYSIIIRRFCSMETKQILDLDS